MDESAHGFVAIVITRGDARVWTAGVEPGAPPERVVAPSEEVRHHHILAAEHQPGHKTPADEARYFESITAAVRDASEILLVGHGKGKSDETLKLTQYWERKHPDLAARVVGTIHSFSEALSEGEVLNLVRDWWREYREFI